MYNYNTILFANTVTIRSKASKRPRNQLLKKPCHVSFLENMLHFLWHNTVQVVGGTAHLVSL